MPQHSDYRSLIQLLKLQIHNLLKGAKEEKHTNNLHIHSYTNLVKLLNKTFVLF